MNTVPLLTEETIIPKKTHGVRDNVPNGLLGDITKYNISPTNKDLETYIPDRNNKPIFKKL